MPGVPVIATFYSYKGGVGRSMAMANVAYDLASRGLRVLAIDFDLEAPGLERYFRVPLDTVYATRGVIDCIESYKRALSGTGSIDSEAEFRQLQAQYICEIARFGAHGALDLMPAGRRLSDVDKRAYALAVRTFDWQDFYFNWEGEAFFEWLRRTLVGHAGSPGLYDVVLADSRTGVTEMGGVCACQLADVVVMFSAANHQNIEGTRELAQDLDSPAVKTLRRNRPPLSIIVAPARVEQRAPDRLPDFVRRFDAAFDVYQPSAFEPVGLRFHELALPYVPEFAFEEQVTDHASSEGRVLIDRFRRLADALLLLSGGQGLQEARAEAERHLRARDGTAARGPQRAYEATQRYAGVDAYLSCSAIGRAQVERIARALAAAPWRLRCQIGDAALYGSSRDLPQGTAEMLNHAQSLVLFVGAEGVLPWQREELKVGRGVPRPPRVVQVLLEGASDDAFELAFGSALRDSPLIDLRRASDDPNGLALLAAALRRTDADSSAHTAAPDEATACPFPGARAYGESDAAAFGGRGGPLDGLLALVASQRRVVLRGPSGAGKTSLVLAGLFPALRQAHQAATLTYLDLEGQRESGPGWRERVPDTPEALVVFDHVDSATENDLGAIGALWQRDDGPRLMLVWRAAPLAAAENEIARRWKSEAAAAAASHAHPLHKRCAFGAAVDGFVAAVSKAPVLELQPLDDTELRTAFEAALARAGRRAEGGLLERLFTDIGQDPSMAAVQRMIAALWSEQRRGFLTNDAYDRLGGIDGVIDEAYALVVGTMAAADRDVRDLLLPRLLRAAPDSVQRRTMSWARECSMPAAGGRAAVVAEVLAREGLLRVTRVKDDVQLAPAHVSRDARAFDAMRERTAAWREAVLRIAGAYARWVAGEDIDDVESAIEEAPLETLAPRLSLGELAFAAAVQRRGKLARTARNTVYAVVALLLGLGFVWNRHTAAQAEADQGAKRDLAITAAQAQQGFSLQVPGPSARADSAPAPTTRTRVVVHRTGSDEADLATARSLASVLAMDRFAVDERIREVAAAQVCGDVRFHHPQDREAAQHALDALNKRLAANGDVRRLDLNDRSNTRAAQPSNEGTLEVWLPPLTGADIERTDRFGTWRLVSAGCAVVGSDEKGRETLRKGLNAPELAFYNTELALHKVWLRAYYIGRTEVTMAQFDAYQRECVKFTSEACSPWRPRFVDPKTEPDRPAVWVSWRQADAYCRWAGGRLPTDLEWEKAARGPDGRFWPWGNKPDDKLFQGNASTPGKPIAVGSFKAGDSPYDVSDMAGNVWEMTADLWRPGDTGHSIRGGSYLNTLMESRASVRWAANAEAAGADFLGFRCVRDVER